MKKKSLFVLVMFLFAVSCNKSEKTDKKQTDTKKENVSKKTDGKTPEKVEDVKHCGKHTEAMKAGDVWHPSVFKSLPPEGTLVSCPIKGETFKYTKSRPHSEYKGKFYVFGCNGCKRIFLKDPETALKKYKFIEAP